VSRDKIAIVVNHTTGISRKHLAFTLVELLAVIAIIVFIVWFLLPVGTTRVSAFKIIDNANLRQIGVGMLQYAAEHNDLLPAHPRDIAAYFTNNPDGNTSLEEIFVSPYFMAEDTIIDRGEFDGPATRYGSYVFVNLGLNLDDIETPSDLILAYTAKAEPEQASRNVLFVDGHVENWEEYKLLAALPKGVDVDALDGP
jgi:prepilin-type processing-associated H-X9-DG protein